MPRLRELSVRGELLAAGVRVVPRVLLFRELAERPESKLREVRVRLDEEERVGVELREAPRVGAGE